MPRRKAEYAQLLELAEEHDRRLTLLADAADQWLALGDLRRAATIYDGLTLLAPNDPTGFLGLAETYLAAGRHLAAAEQVLKAIHAWHCDRITMARAYFLRFVALQAVGAHADATRALKLMIKLDPDGLARTLAQQSARPTARGARS